MRDVGYCHTLALRQSFESRDVQVMGVIPMKSEERVQLDGNFCTCQ